MQRVRLALGLLLALPTVLLAAPPDERGDAFEANRRLGRGINLGNALEAPKEGDWGMTLEAGYFEAIRKAGFDSVRIPIRWSAHAAKEPPYTIDPEFLKRVDWAVEQALSRNLNAIINVHHFGELDTEPDKYEPMLRAIWAQVAEHYRDRPNLLYFELLNEPHDKLSSERWNRMIPPLLAEVRKRNPHRPVIIGPGMWNSFRELDKLKLPETDRDIIVTFHYYEPFHFTHQGAEWAQGSRAWLGTTWTATPEQRKRLAADFDKAAAWSQTHRRPIFLGEFGAYSRADMDSRARWTRAVVEAARDRGFSTAYWEFGSGFGAYDRASRSWNAPLLDALTARAGRSGPDRGRP
jgi:endoglucanase